MAELSAVPIPSTPVPSGFRLRDEILIEPGKARVFNGRSGDVFQLIEVRGRQVGDLMAWLPRHPDEMLSPAHTVSCHGRVSLHDGDELFSTRRRPVLRIRRDTVRRHDLIVPCCDPERYQRDFGLADHPSCLESLQSALTASGEPWRARGEMAWNVFMNNEYRPDGSIVTCEPTSVAGDHVELELLEDLVVAVCACPQDLTPCNGWAITELGLRSFEPLG